MSKTTFFLLVVLFIFVGILLAILVDKNKNSLLNSLTKPMTLPSPLSPVTLSLATTTPTVAIGQTTTVTVLINNPLSHPTLTQIELGYDPQAITIDSINPGNFFTKPEIVLQNIDPNTGRLSYALRCAPNSKGIISDCANSSSSTIAVITLTINPYFYKQTTLLSFLPKTVIRTYNGKDLLYHLSNLQLTIHNSLIPIATSSATASSGANFGHIGPMH